MIDLRIATPEDAVLLAETRLRVWRETYRGIYPDEKLDHYDLAAYACKDRCHLASPSENYYLFMDGEKCVGYFSFGPPHYGTYKDHVLCMNHLYVLKDYQGIGLGRLAFRVIRDYCRSNGIGKFFCGCHARNFPAINFYRHMGGWQEDLSRTDSDKQKEIVHFDFYTGEET